jgi:hypothetical protein
MRSDQQRMRNDRPSTCLDKRKISQISIICVILHYIYRRSLSSYLSPKVQSQNSSTPVQASHTLYLHDPNLLKITILVINNLFYLFVEKSPLERAQFLESTDLFTNIHAAAAASGQTAVPDNLDTDLHFTCFVQAPDASAREAEVATSERRLIELDGGRAGPVDRGKSTDLLEVR